MEIGQADFSKLAHAFGAAALVAETPKDLAAVEQWVQDGARGTLLVDLRVSGSVVAPFILEIVDATLKK